MLTGTCQQEGAEVWTCAPPKDINETVYVVKWQEAQVTHLLSLGFLPNVMLKTLYSLHHLIQWLFEVDTNTVPFHSWGNQEAGESSKAAGLLCVCKHFCNFKQFLKPHYGGNATSPAPGQPLCPMYWEFKFLHWKVSRCSPGRSRTAAALLPQANTLPHSAHNSEDNRFNSWSDLPTWPQLSEILSSGLSAVSNQGEE